MNAMNSSAAKRGSYRKPTPTAEGEPAWLVLLRRLHAEGYSDSQLARKLGPGWHRGSVGYWRRRLGLPSTKAHPRQHLARQKRLKKQLDAVSMHTLKERQVQAHCDYQARKGWPEDLIFAHGPPPHEKMGIYLGRLRVREVQLLCLLYQAGHTSACPRLTRAQLLDGLLHWPRERYGALGLHERPLRRLKGKRDYLRALVERGLVLRAGWRTRGKDGQALYAIRPGLVPHVPPTKRPRSYELNRERKA